MRTHDFATAEDLLRRAGFKLNNDGEVQSYVNLLRASVGDNPHHWRYVMAAFTETRPRAACEAGAYPLKLGRILLGALCLKLGYGAFYDHLMPIGPVNGDMEFFEKAADPGFYTDIYPDENTADYAALFIQGFYNLIADTGHLITPAHMCCFWLALELAEKLAPLPGIRRAVIDTNLWRLRSQNRQIIKTANAALADLFPAAPFRVFQQDYEADGVLAVNATAYHDFDSAVTDFVLDCRLDTDKENLTTDVALALFCRRNKDRFVDAFKRWPWVGELQFALEPAHKWFIRCQVTGLKAGDTEALAAAVIDEVKLVLPQLPL